MDQAFGLEFCQDRVNVIVRFELLQLASMGSVGA